MKLRMHTERHLALYVRKFITHATNAYAAIEIHNDRNRKEKVVAKAVLR